MHIYYEVTNKCNIKCPYCYSKSNELDYVEIKMDEFCKCFFLVVNLCQNKK